ncbi:hypothetical protein THAOC_24394, partial [Thalassiosira oceanica]
LAANVLAAIHGYRPYYGRRQLGRNRRRRFNNSGSVFHAEPTPPCTKAYQNQNSPRRLWTDHDANSREHDDADVDERNLRQTITFDDDELDKACESESSDPPDPEVPRAELPQLGPHTCNLSSSGPPEQISQTVSFDEDELDEACDPSDPLDPEAPHAEPTQHGPNTCHLPSSGPPERTDQSDRLF